MTKNFCDRCCREIKPKTLFKNERKYDVWLRSELMEWGYKNTVKHLCFDCASKLKKWLTGKDFEDA